MKQNHINICAPDEAAKEEIQSRKTDSFIDSLRVRRELRRYLKDESVYARITKPFKDAESLITQVDYYTHYEELEEKIFCLSVPARNNICCNNCLTSTINYFIIY